MGLIKRLKRVTLAKIELFLQSLEDPEFVYPQLVAEMKERAADAGRAEAKSITAVRAAQRRIDEHVGRVARLGAAAALAFNKDQEELAREALTAQIEAEHVLVRCRRELDTAKVAFHQAKEARLQMQAELESLNTRKQEIILRAKLAKVQKQVWKSTTSVSGFSILDAVAAIEKRLSEEETLLGLQNDAVQETLLAERLKEHERQSEIERRLDQLRRKEIHA